MLSGVPDRPDEQHPETFRIKQSQEAQDQSLWYSGGGALTLVNCAKNFEKTTLEDFLTKEGQDGPLELVMAIAITRPAKVLALCVSSTGSYLLKSFEVQKSKGRWFNCFDMYDEKKARSIKGRVFSRELWSKEESSRNAAAQTFSTWARRTPSVAAQKTSGRYK